MKFKKNFLKLQNTYLKVNFERTVNVTNLFLKLNPKKEYSIYLLLHSKPHQSLGAKNINYIYFAQRSAISLGLDSVGSPLFYLVSSGTAQRQGSWNHWRRSWNHCSVICLAVDAADCSKNYKSSFHMAWTSLQLGSWVPRVAFQKERSRWKPIVYYDPALDVMQHHFLYICIYKGTHKRSSPKFGKEKLTLHLLMGECQSAGYFCVPNKHFWALFNNAVNLLENSLILSNLTFKIC